MLLEPHHGLVKLPDNIFSEVLFLCTSDSLGRTCINTYEVIVYVTCCVTLETQAKTFTHAINS